MDPGIFIYLTSRSDCLLSTVHYILISFLSVYVPVLWLFLLHPALRYSPTFPGLFIVVTSQCSAVWLVFVRLFLVPGDFRSLESPGSRGFRVSTPSIFKAGSDCLWLRAARADHLREFHCWVAPFRGAWVNKFSVFSAVADGLLLYTAWH